MLASAEAPRTRRLLVLSGLVVIMHTGTGCLEEVLFKSLEFKSAFFMILFMCVLYMVGYLAVRGAVLPPVFTAGIQRGDRQAMFLLCIAYAGSNSLSKLALNFVSIPTMIVFKSCKLVFVMLGATVIMGKAYTLLEYTIALGLVSGLISFSLADIRGSIPSHDENSQMLIGILVLLMALCFDAVLGNLQEKVQKTKVCDEHSLMFVQSLASACMLLVWTALTGELAEGLHHCWRDSRVFVALCSWALSNMAGIIVMLRVVGEFSAVMAVILSLVRKMASLFVSYSFFPKVFTAGHALGLVLVFCSVTVHSFRRQFVQIFDKSKKELSTGDTRPRPSYNNTDVSLQHLAHHSDGDSDKCAQQATQERDEANSDQIDTFNVSVNRLPSRSPPSSPGWWGGGFGRTSEKASVASFEACT